MKRRTRIRDQERTPVAADLKRTMWEKARLDAKTFELVAVVTEAHRSTRLAVIGLSSAASRWFALWMLRALRITGRGLQERVR